MIGGLRQGTRVVPLAAIALGAIAWLCAAKAQPEGPEQVFELRIEGGEVTDGLRRLRDGRRPRASALDR